ncbi:hypothetical protein QBZ16_002460 [Prototheca wickerhamii]|uniref:Uncharacterized protein n=1 Tax=Prototheca wickerhamii TaxID=3111 RepID=A0AAD9IMN8_PROWI|nr:hypothetical protein QBZ16_002460 [Prototheca wickerhamii]
MGNVFGKSRGEVVVAKTLVAQGKKERALIALKKKRLHSQQLDWLDKLVLNVEETLANVEGAARQKHLFDTLQKSNAALRQLQKEVPLEAVEKLMSDTAEAREYEQEVQSMFGESWTGTDEAAAEAELEEMEAQMQDAEILEMPAVPQTAVPVEKKEAAVPAAAQAAARPVSAGREEESPQLVPA